MEKNIVFKHENYNIASDIRLEADVAYVQGHPIVKTKSIVLHYGSSTFRASEYGNAFTDRLIKDVIDPIYVVELMNYLSMIINGNFLFEIYAKPPQEPESLVEATFAKQRNMMKGGAPLHRKIEEYEVDESLYHEGLIKHRQFVKSALLSRMNARFSRTFSSIEELNYVPVYGYISANGVVEHSKIAEPILHLAIVFNVLAHQDRFAGINNQEAIASFNSIMKAKRLNETAESLNKHEYEQEIRRLKLELQRERERANGLEIAKKTLEEKIDEVNAQLQASAQREQQAQAERQQLQSTLNETNERLTQASAQRDEIQATLNQFRTDVRTSFGELQTSISNQFTGLTTFVNESITGLNLTPATTVWWFAVIDRPALTQSFRDRHVIDRTMNVFDTICCIYEDRNDKLRKHQYDQATDRIVLQYRCSNALDISHFMRERFNEEIARCLNIKGVCSRKIAYREGSEDAILRALTHHLTSVLAVRTSIVERLEASQMNLRQDLTDRLDRIATQVTEVAEQVHSIQDLFNEMYGQANLPPNQILSCGRYRDLNRNANGTITYRPRVNADEIELTANDLLNATFRNVNNVRFRNGRRI